MSKYLPKLSIYTKIVKHSKLMIDIVNHNVTQNIPTSSAYHVHYLPKF